MDKNKSLMSKIKQSLIYRYFVWIIIFVILIISLNEMLNIFFFEKFFNFYQYKMCTFFEILNVITKPTAYVMHSIFNFNIILGTASLFRKAVYFLLRIFIDYSIILLTYFLIKFSYKKIKNRYLKYSYTGALIVLVLIIIFVSLVKCNIKIP